MPRRIIPLTDSKIRSLRPSAKDTKHFDGGGLYLLLTPTGSRLWRLKYRFGGREKLLAIGSYPHVTLAAARHRREEVKTMLVLGVDPAEEQRERETVGLKEKETFEMVAREWHIQFSSQWAPRTAKAIMGMLKRNTFVEIGNLPIDTIDAPKLLNMLRRIEMRGAIYSAHRIRGLCSQIFRYAVSTGRAQRDPTGDLKGAIAPIKTKHLPATTDPQKLAPILRMLDSYDQGTLVVRCALRLLPLLFVRPGELRTMKWADVDLDKGEWAYIVPKTKIPHVVPLAKQAVKILQEIQPLTADGVYVFPSARSNSAPMSDMAINAGMRRMGIDTKTEITGHGFRAVARTILDEVLGFRPDFIEHQLAHAVRDPLGRAYNRTAHLEERRKMMQKWADYLDGLKVGQR